MTKRRSNLRDLVEASKGLAHPARLRLLAMLATGELCVCQMTAVLELAPSTVSQHLSVLSRGGLVADRKEGKLVYYRLGDGEMAEAVLDPLLSLLAEDEQVKADRTVVGRLREIPVMELCAADLDLVAIGIAEPPSPSQSPKPMGGSR
ncbi:MAG: metalloregulator ArsR/SmtB family transcription factor [Acidobacteriota bacterium]|nr:metalloregulator ArsR/SmtB family transcription factor [Acidobacteriota bacterium]